MRAEDEARRQTTPSYENLSAPHLPNAHGGEPTGQPLPPTQGRKRVLLLGALAAALAVGLYVTYGWWTVGRHLVSTEDAYVHVDYAVIAPKVTGYVARVAVRQNQRVAAGDALVMLDDGDYALALASAEARLESQRSTLERFDKQIGASAAAVDQALAQKTAADADSERAASDFARYQTLEKSDFASRQRLESSKADRDRAVAAVAQATAGIAAAEANRDVVRAQRVEAEQALKELELARDRARRDLDATVLRAPFDGVAGNLAASVGDYVSPGKRLLAVVPLDAIYIDANFKETQIADLKPGTPVTIEVDAYPGRELHGEVTGVAPASGAVFSLLPPENATGNFTKIVQRVPVRVKVPADVAAEGVLRPGLSVVVTADPHGVTGRAAADEAR